MGSSTDYPNVPDWEFKDTGYQTGAMVKYQGNIFVADFWAQAEPGKKPKPEEGWALYDELYDLTTSGQTEQAKIIAYIPTWRKREGFKYTNSEMYRYITHGIIAFLMFSEFNLGEFEPSSVNEVYAILTDVVNTGHENGTRILIALGGATDYGFLNLMTSIGNNPDSPLLNQVVQNVVNFVNSNNLDGVDLDLECWWDRNGDASKDQGGRYSSQGAHPAGYALTLFAQKLKQTMPDKLVSAAIFGTSWYGNNYDPKLADYVDWLGIMTYDLTGSWNSSPVGPHSGLYKIRQKAKEPSTVTHSGPFQEDYQAEQQGSWPAPNENRSSSDPILDNPILSMEDTLWYWTNPLFVNWQGAGQKLPRNKIAAGVPIYGYDFAYSKALDDLSGQIPPGYKAIRYKDILAQFPNAHTAVNANIKVSGSTPRPAFISASGNYQYAHNIYFETPGSAVTKLNFLKGVGAQGVIIWELSNDVWEDAKSIIKALYRNSGNLDSRPALPNKVAMPSDMLTPLIERMKSYTIEFATEIDQGREQEKSRLSLLVEPSLVETIIRFLNSAGKPNGEEIKQEDSAVLIEEWREIEQNAKEYEASNSDALNRLTDLKNKVDQLVRKVEEKSRSENGWLFIPFYSLAVLFQTYISLESFVKSNPQNPDPNRDEDEEKKCQRQADEVSQKIQNSIDILTISRKQWPAMDLGPVGAVLGIPIPPPSTSPPWPPTFEGYTYDVEISIFFLDVEVFFQNSDRPGKSAGFKGRFAPFGGLAITGLRKGTAKLLNVVESLANHPSEVSFSITYGPGGLNLYLYFSKNSGAVGHISSSHFTSLLPAVGFGQGQFLLDLSGNSKRVLRRRAIINLPRKN